MLRWGRPGRCLALRVTKDEGDQQLLGDQRERRDGVTEGFLWCLHGGFELEDLPRDPKQELRKRLPRPARVSGLTSRSLLVKVVLIDFEDFERLLYPRSDPVPQQ